MMEVPRPKLPKIPVFKKQLDAVKALATIPPERLLDVLEHSGNTKFEALSRMMQDKNFKRYTFPQMLTMNGIGVKDVAVVFKDHMIAEGTIAQMQHAPDILETNAVAAKGKEMLCPTCRGKKILTEECQRCEGAGKDDEGHPCRACKELGVVEIGPCRTCGATGWVTEAGDANALKGFMESAGLSKQNAPMVNIQQNFGNSGSFEQLMMEAERKAANPKVIEGKAE